MAKIDLTAGSLQISVDGEEAWVAKQFENIIEKFPVLSSFAAAMPAKGGEPDLGADDTAKPVGSLATHIKEHGGDKSQTRRFLATADWLRRKGDKSLKTSKVSSALKDNQQKKLANPSQCLNDNVSQGFCEKDSQGFFITPEGLKELGYNA